ncbi:hypothetical protein V6N13_106788 [Hibiscus sabdariffa]
MADVEQEMTTLGIGEGEDDGVQIDLEDLNSQPSLDYCFVGSFLTAIIINFQSMRSTIANVGRNGLMPEWDASLRAPPRRAVPTSSR